MKNPFLIPFPCCESFSVFAFNDKEWDKGYKSVRTSHQNSDASQDDKVLLTPDSWINLI